MGKRLLFKQINGPLQKGLNIFYKGTDFLAFTNYLTFLVLIN